MSKDTIYRQDAIDAVEFGIIYAKAFNVNTGESNELFKEGNEALKKAVERLKELPSAQPEQRWISCSERLPDIGEPVLISALMPLCTMVYIGYLSDDVWFCDRLFFRSDEVVAWMPLPDAYEDDE